MKRYTTFMNGEIHWQFFKNYSIDSVQHQNLSRPFIKKKFKTLTLKFIWKCKGSRITKIILKKEAKVGGLMLLDFKTIYKASLEVWYDHGDRHICQWIRIESSNKPHLCQFIFFFFCQFIFDRSAKEIQGERTDFLFLFFI